MSEIATDITRQVEKFRNTISRADCPIVAIAMVRDEADIVERFVRHTICWADALLMVDHASFDDTPIILQKLIEEGLPLCVVRDDALGKHQSDRMTLLARSAATLLDAHIIVPLDADEFLIETRGRNPRPLLTTLSSDVVTCAHWRSYVPTPLDDPSELDVLRRIRHRLAHEAAGVTKVIIGGSLARDVRFRMGYGSHWLFSNAAQMMPHVDSPFYLCHFPVRSAGQITAKALLGPLAGMLDPERPNTAQAHYGWLKRLGTIHSYMSASELQTVAELYALNNKKDSPRLIFDPVDGGPEVLRYTSQTSVDPAFRIERFVRTLLTTERDDAPTALRKLISDENTYLRTTRDEAVARLELLDAEYQRLDAEYQRMTGSRAVRTLIKIRRFLKWISRS